MKHLRSLLKNKLLWISIISLFIIMKMASGYFSEAVKSYTESIVRNYSEALIANSVEDELIDDLNNAKFLIEKYDENGKVSYAYINSLKINQIRNDVILYMDQAINLINDHSDFDHIKIPIGYLFGIKYFFPHNIRIPINLEVIGNQDVELKINTLSQGLNTTIVEIYLDISVDIQVVIPFQSEITTTITSIPLSIEIMNNEIPYYYGDIIR